MVTKKKQGAEAIITIKDNLVTKDRIQKNYRISQIDEKLRRRRTKREAKVLKELPIPGPKLIQADKHRIVMEYIDGKKLSETLEQLDYEAIMTELGKNVRKMHDQGLIHGDLTTSNMIYSDKLYLIDFGLSTQSDHTEEKAVDIHLLHQALLSKHHTIYKECFKAFSKSYNDKAVLKRLATVEARGRNKTKDTKKV